MVLCAFMFKYEYFYVCVVSACVFTYVVVHVHKYLRVHLRRIYSGCVCVCHVSKWACVLCVLDTKFPIVKVIVQGGFGIRNYVNGSNCGSAMIPLRNSFVWQELCMIELYKLYHGAPHE